MKKNISINISGIIFHIEEDGYDRLKKYLDSIHNYFGAFEDSSEILADIESRIAELFLSKLSEGKQVITAEDVETLQATMGNVNDFKAAEAQEVPLSDNSAGTPRAEQPRQEQGAPRYTSRKLYRDEKRKILGGIGAGLGNYFKIDPVWPRLILALLAFSTYGAGILLYVLLWILLPVSDTLEDEPSVRKMYRDSGNKVLGGVAAGVAAFFGTEASLIRVLFIVFAIIGGAGILVYIILWIALPEAKSITEKMEMQGEPVTLSNIETSIKKGIHEKEGQEESALAKVLLFPFRLLAALINGLAQFLGPVVKISVDILRIAIGVLILAVGLLMIFALLVSAGITLGIFGIPDWGWVHDWQVNTPNIPLQAFRNTFSGWVISAGILAALTPLVFMSLLGFSIIARRLVFNSYVGWTLFVIFFLAVGYLSFTIPPIAYGFKEEAEFKTEETFPVTSKTVILNVNEVGLDDYEVTELTLRPHEANTIRIVRRFQAQGRTKKNAIENAQTVSYRITRQDSVLTFDSNIQFSDTAKFRGQRLNVDVFMPATLLFQIDPELWRIIDNTNFGWRRDIGINSETHTFQFKDGQIGCVSCLAGSDGNDFRESDTTSAKADRPAPFADELGLTNFDAIDIRGLAEVHIQKGTTYAVKMEGPERLRKRYDLSVVGQTLIVDFDDDRSFFWRGRSADDERVRIFIMMPALQDFEMSGAGDARLVGFREDELDIELSGAVVLEGYFNAQNLVLDISGASSADIAGNGDFLEADITGASSLKAFGFEVKKAVIEVHGASSAKVFASESVEISKGVASSVSTRGGAQVIER